MRTIRFLSVLILTVLLLTSCAAALEPLSVQLYASAHFSFAVPEGWTCREEEGLFLFEAPAADIFAGAILSAEEVDVSDHVPFDPADLYQAYATSLGGTGNKIDIDGHAASFLELESQTGCLCVVLYCRGVNLLALSATSPELQPDAIRTLLLNMVRYTAYQP